MLHTPSVVSIVATIADAAQPCWLGLFCVSTFYALLVCSMWVLFYCLKDLRILFNLCMMDSILQDDVVFKWIWDSFTGVYILFKLNLQWVLCIVICLRDGKWESWETWKFLPIWYISMQMGLLRSSCWETTSAVSVGRDEAHRRALWNSFM